VARKPKQEWIEVELWATPAVKSDECLLLAEAFVEKHPTPPGRAVLKLKESGSGGKKVVVAIGRRQGQQEEAHVSKALFDRVFGDAGVSTAVFRKASWFDLLRYRRATRLGVIVAVLTLIAAVLSAVLAFVSDAIWWLPVAVLASACLAAAVTAYRDLGQARSLSC
jgi:hypothetical protein